MSEGGVDAPRASLMQVRPLDPVDRALLALLSDDATRSYAALGAAVGLSAPAAHERVKRMKRAGVIRGTVALVDPLALDRSFGAFVHVDVAAACREIAIAHLAGIEEVQELHVVAGEAPLVLKVRTASPAALDAFLSRLTAIEGIARARAAVILSTPLERPLRLQPQTGASGGATDGSIIPVHNG